MICADLDAVLCCRLGSVLISCKLVLLFCTAPLKLFYSFQVAGKASYTVLLPGDDNAALLASAGLRLPFLWTASGTWVADHCNDVW